MEQSFIIWPLAVLSRQILSTLLLDFSKIPGVICHQKEGMQTLKYVKMLDCQLAGWLESHQESRSDCFRKWP